MKPRVWISEMGFSDGSKITINKEDIVVLVGPNNSGKSASLKEANALLMNVTSPTKVVKGITIDKEGTAEDIIAHLDKISHKQHTSNPDPYYVGFGFHLYGGSIESQWNNNSNGLGDISKVFSKIVTTEERLTASNPANNIRITTEPPQHPIHFLQKDNTLELKFSNYFKQAFGLDLLIHRNAGSEVPLYIGNRASLPTGKDSSSMEYNVTLETMDRLNEQGDGMRSFVGVLLNAFTSPHSILFIDEPEAFLHPPQARLLGKMIASDLPAQSQLFLSTHSEDFLQGLLESGAPNLKIIRIQREESINKVHVLDGADINTIWNDSLLRHSNILNGLFHSQVVICESDSDCRFFSSVLSVLSDEAEKPIPDILFAHCGGKHRIPVAIKALKNLNVPIKVICDFDVLNDQNPLKEIFEDLGGKWNEVGSLWKTVKDAIESKRPEFLTVDAKAEISRVLNSITDRIFPKNQVSVINKILKKVSAWTEAKEVGKPYIPSGDATKAFEQLLTSLNSKGLILVEVGELEGFVRSIGNHGPKWISEVLATKDLLNDPELDVARNFVKKHIH